MYRLMVFLVILLLVNV